MRIAIVSDVHGNLTAFEAVLADIRDLSPDVVVHGGDLADPGASPVDIIDRIRDLGWAGVLGNADQMLFAPDSLEKFVSTSKAPPILWENIREMAKVTRDTIGAERLEWLSRLPLGWGQSGLTVVHAGTEDCWRSPSATATDEDLERAFTSIAQPLIIFGHIHVPFIRKLERSLRTICNSGSVGMPYDGDPRASYLVVDGITPSIRRVEYDVEREIRALQARNSHGTGWIVNMLRTSRPQMP